MKIWCGKGFGISERNNRKELEIIKTTYPLGINYGNKYWDGVKYECGKEQVRVSSFGGGNGWARRGSMSECWEDEGIHFINKEEFEKILREVDEIDKEEDEIEREAKIRNFVKKELEYEI